jgi:hypothetical protein
LRVFDFGGVVLTALFASWGASVQERLLGASFSPCFYVIGLMRSFLSFASYGLLFLYGSIFVSFSLARMGVLVLFVSVGVFLSLHQADAYRKGKGILTSFLYRTASLPQIPISSFAISLFFSSILLHRIDLSEGLLVPFLLPPQTLLHIHSKHKSDITDKTL